MGTEIRGIAASDGLYLGPVRHLSRQAAQRAGSGDPHTEREALKDALALSIAELSDLMARVDGEAQDILGFQVAMLEDDALSAPALMAIDSGVVADQAWAAALDGEIAGYEASDDDYFRARAADLKDMRDRVLRHLSGDEAVQSTEGAVLVGDDIAPTAFLETDWSKGGAIALAGGSATSHVAMLARARGIAMVVGLGATALHEAATLIVDGTKGVVIADPDADALSRHAEDFAKLRVVQAMENQFRLLPAQRRDGSRVELLVNVAGVEELDHLDVNDLRWHRADAFGIPVPRWRTAARRGRAVSGLSALSRMGRWTACHDPHARHWRRQAGARIDARGRVQSLPWASRRAADAGAGRRVPHAIARTRKSIGPWTPQGYDSHGHGAG